MRTPRATLLALLAVFVGACGGAEPPPSPQVAIASPATATAAAPAPPQGATVFAGLPSGSVLTASLDGGALSNLLALRSDLVPEELWSHLAEIAPGIDAARPITLALGGPSSGARQAIDALRPLIPAAEPGPSGGQISPQKVHEAIAAARTTLTLRVLIPAKEPARLRGAIGAFLERAGFEPEDRERAQGRRRVAIHTTADTLVVDLAVGPEAHAELARLRSLTAAEAREAPPLEGRAARMRFKPADLADLGFLHGVAMTDGALAMDAISPDQRAQLAAQGVWESARSFALAGTDKGAYFDAVDLSLRTAAGKVDLAVTANVGPGMAALPEDAWKPSPSVALPDGRALVDIAQAFSKDWGFPGDPGGRDGRSRIIDTIRAAGWPGYLVGMPWLLAELPRIQLGAVAGLVEERKGGVPFARTGLLSQEDHARVFFAVLPEKTSRAAAECVLAGKAPCSGPLKLKAGVVTPVYGKDRFARLVQAEGRFVLFVSRDKDALPAQAGLRELGPLRIELAPPALLARERIPLSGVSLPARLIGGVEGNARQIVFRLATP